MLIGEIVQQTGVSRDTIRYYEKMGLLQAEGRPSPFNNYKAYPATTVTRLVLIQRAKDLGFTLAEIADVLDLWANEQLPAAEKKVRIAGKLSAIDEKIAQLQSMRANLLRSMDEVLTNCRD
ncbi:MerR family DNA-binding protein [Hymenobacter terrenus]|uniref:MerR family DNA-binding protein n=1 Tax=Hymenobacter terrenus TaxID=1629124 RepID=UPI000619AE61|nr:MerR family DNA-binding protein [Hymenobacter terrenus]